MYQSAWGRLVELDLQHIFYSRHDIEDQSVVAQVFNAVQRPRLNRVRLRILLSKNSLGSTVPCRRTQVGLGVLDTVRVSAVYLTLSIDFFVVLGATHTSCLPSI